MTIQLTISYGDTQDGPEILDAMLQQLADAGAIFEIETVQLGAEMEKLGFEKGFDEDVLRKLRCSGVLFKAPTKKDVASALKQELGDACTIFEPSAATPEAMQSAALALLEYMQQHQIAEIIRHG